MARTNSRFRFLVSTVFWAWIAAGCTRPAATASVQKAVDARTDPLVHVKILGINDFHGQLSPKKLQGRPVGGAAVLASYLRSASAGQEDRTLIVHAGDLVGASPANSALLQDEPSISFMNLFANEACDTRRLTVGPCNVVGAVGNHELDEGLSELRRLLEGGLHAKGPFLENPWQGARYPTVSANILDATTRRPVFPPYVVRQVGGTQLAVVGAVLRSAPSIVTASGVAGLAFDDEADSVNRVIPELHAQGIHAIVLLIHQGLTQPAYTGPTRSDVAAPTGALLDIIRRLDDDVDVVVSGHTHQFTNLRIANAHGKSMLVVQAWSASTAFDDIDIEIDPASQDIVAARASIVTPWGDQGPGLTPDAAAAKLVARADAAVAPRVEQVVGQSSAPIERKVDDAGESVLGDVIADALREVTGADFAVENPGGIRADLPAGTITWGDVFAVQPFGNGIVTLTLTGQDLLDLLNQQWAREQPPGGRVLSISGFGYSVSRASAEVRPRIVEAHDGHGHPIVPSRSYTLATNQYVAQGGDGFSLLARLKPEESGRVDCDALADYLKKAPRPLPLPTSRRIVLVRRP
ncbi:MAG: bifunctional metallophosphatase/5'-nucleotidase [Polyangiaceae bacterium]|jgi:5'-nucleotidase